jgi:hypothetical protein
MQENYRIACHATLALSRQYLSDFLGALRERLCQELCTPRHRGQETRLPCLLPLALIKIKPKSSFITSQTAHDIERSSDSDIPSLVIAQGMAGSDILESIHENRLADS